MLVFDVINSKFFAICHRKGDDNVAKMFFNTQDDDTSVRPILMAPDNVTKSIKRSYDDYIMSSWRNDSFNAMYADRTLICVKHANIIPLTRNGIVCTFLPFFHAAALYVSGDYLQQLILFKHTSTLNWLMREYAPKWLTMATIDVGKPPQIEPQKFDRALDGIYSFEDFRLLSRPVWESAKLQTEAREFQKRICVLSGGEDFSGPITYHLKASEIRLDVPYESWAIYPEHHAILLVQRDKVAGT